MKKPKKFQKKIIEKGEIKFIDVSFKYPTRQDKI